MFLLSKLIMQTFFFNFSIFFENQLLKSSMISFQLSNAFVDVFKFEVTQSTIAFMKYRGFVSA